MEEIIKDLQASITTIAASNGEHILAIANSAKEGIINHEKVALLSNGLGMIEGLKYAIHKMETWPV